MAQTQQIKRLNHLLYCNAAAKTLFAAIYITSIYNAVFLLPLGANVANHHIEYMLLIAQTILYRMVNYIDARKMLVDYSAKYLVLK